MLAIAKTFIHGIQDYRQNISIQKGKKISTQNNVARAVFCRMDIFCWCRSSYTFPLRKMSKVYFEQNRKHYENRVWFQSIQSTYPTSFKYSLNWKKNRLAYRWHRTLKACTIPIDGKKYAFAMIVYYCYRLKTWMAQYSSTFIPAQCNQSTFWLTKTHWIHRVCLLYT